jgi:TatD DNase family protein
MSAAIVYKYRGNLYINLTNRCTNACSFCIKRKWEWKYRGKNLRLKREPTPAEVIKAIGDPKKYPEIVFCGYGEPTLRLDVLKEVAAWIKSKGGKVRLNTTGLASLRYSRNVALELKGLVDAVSISLNAGNSKDYQRVQRPRFGPRSYRAVLAFIRECKKFIPEVTITCIPLPNLDISKCPVIAKKLGVLYRERPYLSAYEIK